MNKPGAIILGGGLSRRMGRPKATLPIGGETMLARVARIVSEVASPIVVVSAPDGSPPRLDRPFIQARDEVSGRGPLQGLAAGLRALPPEVEFAYATATDVPFLEPRWVSYLSESIGDHDLAIPLVDGFHHPLAALYRRSTILPTIDRLLTADRLRPVYLMESCRTRIVTEAEYRAVDPSAGTLRNLNTPEDYRAALIYAGFTAPNVVFELHGVPRLRAGFARLPCRAWNLGEALDALAQAAPALRETALPDGEIHPAYRLNINGDRFATERSTLLVEGDELLFLSADVGG